MAGVNEYKDGVVTRLYKGLQGLVKGRKITYVEGEGRLVGARPRSRWTAALRRPPRRAGHRLRTPRSLPGLEIDGERVITSDHALTPGPGARARRSCSAAASSAASSPASGSPSAPRSPSSRRCRTWCRSRTRRVSKLLERAFRKRRIGFKLGNPFESVRDTPTPACGSPSRTARRSRPSCCWSPSAAARHRRARLRGAGRRDGARLRHGRRAAARPTSPTISAVGDLVPGLQLAHVGFAEGIFVAERIAGLDPRADRRRRRPAGHLLRPGGRLGRAHRGAGQGEVRRRTGRVADLRPGRQRQEPDPQDRGRSSSWSGRRTVRWSASTWSAAGSAS